MWIKDGKILDGQRIIYNDKIYFNPSDRILKQAGYVWQQPVIQEPISVAKRYSTLKIIRALGNEWETYKTMMADVGVLDQFFAANYLSQNDEVFMSFMNTLPSQLKERLDNECIWEEN